MTNLKNRLIYVMGVSGSGKTTIGQLLGQELGLPFYDGDDFHPPQNIQKMKSGQALQDEDRHDWLVNIHTFAQSLLQDQGGIIACSALKEKYRKLLSQNIAAQCFWVFLEGDFKVIQERMQKREGHFMPAKLLESQFEALEKPSPAIYIDIQNTPETIIQLILKELNDVR